MANLTLIKPEFGPWGPDPTPKVGSIRVYFVDLSLNPKLDPFFGHTNPIFDPEGPAQSNFGPCPGGPDINLDPDNLNWVNHKIRQ